MINKLFNTSLIMEKALDASWLRNNVISNNIANVDTPNYKRQRVEFEKQLKEAIEVDNKKKNLKTLPMDKRKGSSISQLKPKVITETGTSNRVDKNNVNIDVEMSELTSNTLMYNTLAQQITKSYSRIKLVINEGRK